MFSGVLCEEDIDDCEPQPCSQGSTCVDLPNAFDCLCQPGLTGSVCVGVCVCVGGVCVCLCL